MACALIWLSIVPTAIPFPSFVQAQIQGIPQDRVAVAREHLERSALLRIQLYANKQMVAFLQLEPNADRVRTQPTVQEPGFIMACGVAKLSDPGVEMTRMLRYVGTCL